MNSSQAPSLPYVRDEASTSQHLSAYPSHPPTTADSYAVTSTGTPEELYDEDGLLEDGEDMERGIGGDGNALQFWASKRHMQGRKVDKGEEEYCESSDLAPARAGKCDAEIQLVASATKSC